MDDGLDAPSCSLEPHHLAAATPQHEQRKAQTLVICGACCCSHELQAAPIGAEGADRTAIIQVPEQPQVAPCVDLLVPLHAEEQWAAGRTPVGSLRHHMLRSATATAVGTGASGANSPLTGPRDSIHDPLVDSSVAQPLLGWARALALLPAADTCGESAPLMARHSVAANLPRAPASSCPALSRVRQGLRAAAKALAHEEARMLVLHRGLLHQWCALAAVAQPSTSVAPSGVSGRGRLATPGGAPHSGGGTQEPSETCSMAGAAHLRVACLLTRPRRRPGLPFHGGCQAAVQPPPAGLAVCASPAKGGAAARDDGEGSGREAAGGSLLSCVNPLFWELPAPRAGNTDACAREERTAATHGVVLRRNTLFSDAGDAQEESRCCPVVWHPATPSLSSGGAQVLGSTAGWRDVASSSALTFIPAWSAPAPLGSHAQPNLATASSSSDSWPPVEAVAEGDAWGRSRTGGHARGPPLNPHLGGALGQGYSTSAIDTAHVPDHGAYVGARGSRSSPDMSAATGSSSSLLMMAAATGHRRMAAATWAALGREPHRRACSTGPHHGTLAMVTSCLNDVSGACLPIGSSRVPTASGTNVGPSPPMCLVPHCRHACGAAATTGCLNTAHACSDAPDGCSCWRASCGAAMSHAASHTGEAADEAAAEIHVVAHVSPGSHQGGCTSTEALDGGGHKLVARGVSCCSPPDGRVNQQAMAGVEAAEEVTAVGLHARTAATQPLPLRRQPLLAAGPAASREAEARGRLGQLQSPLVEQQGGLMECSTSSSLESIQLQVQQVHAASLALAQQLAQKRQRVQQLEAQHEARLSDPECVQQGPQLVGALRAELEELDMACVEKCLELHALQLWTYTHLGASERRCIPPALPTPAASTASAAVARPDVKPSTGAVTQDVGMASCAGGLSSEDMFRLTHIAPHHAWPCPAATTSVSWAPLRAEVISSAASSHQWQRPHVQDAMILVPGQTEGGQSGANDWSPPTPSQRSSSGARTHAAQCGMPAQQLLTAATAEAHIRSAEVALAAALAVLAADPTIHGGSRYARRAHTQGTRDGQPTTQQTQPVDSANRGAGAGVRQASSSANRCRSGGQPACRTRDLDVRPGHPSGNEQCLRNQQQATTTPLLASVAWTSLLSAAPPRSAPSEVFRPNKIPGLGGTHATPVSLPQRRHCSTSSPDVICFPIVTGVSRTLAAQQAASSHAAIDASGNRRQFLRPNGGVYQEFSRGVLASDIGPACNALPASPCKTSQQHRWRHPRYATRSPMAACASGCGKTEQAVPHFTLQKLTVGAAAGGAAVASSPVLSPRGVHAPSTPVKDHPQKGTYDTLRHQSARSARLT